MRLLRWFCNRLTRGLFLQGFLQDLYRFAQGFGLKVLGLGLLGLRVSRISEALGFL